VPETQSVKARTQRPVNGLLPTSV